MTAAPSGSASARLETCLERIARLDPELKAFITVTAEPARAAARRCDSAAAEGRTLGPLHGLIVAIKDCIDVEATRGTWGSAFCAQRIAAADAPAVARLRAAGAIIVGTTNLHELAYGGTTQNPHFGSCRNPWDLERVPGGSSGGSAVAVAAGLCEVALGTDTGASIRLPAALTGTTGLRPTHGAVSGRGCMPVSPPHDVIGPLARSVADVERTFRVIEGFDAEDPYSRIRPAGGSRSDAAGGRLDGLRIALPGGYFRDGVEPAAVEALAAAARVLEGCGARLIEGDLPLAAEAQDHLNPIVYADAADFHRERLREAPERFGRAVYDRLQPGLELRAIDYARGLRWLERFRHSLARFFEDAADAILLPATQGPAPPIAASDDAIAATAALSRFFWLAPAGGLPALALPCGQSAEGMPLGLQLLAPPWREDLLFRLGRSYQERTEWHLRRPPLAAGPAQGVDRDPGAA
jgi:aspartyl-tRNA(Asn)/glutamyl-tRNA(Gln) amidotransferase subunit A